MNRREFLRRTVSDGAKVSAGVALGGLTACRDVGSRSVAQLNRKVKAMGDRIDKLETRQKNLVRTGLLFAGISTGLDLTLLL
ncbi:MAG: hypothetical protein HUJ31_14370 [Pseudomonadales bacterium]|nr:hypothetical protein [Pseudomonadales bacterium]